MPKFSPNSSINPIQQDTQEAAQLLNLLKAEMDRRRQMKSDQMQQANFDYTQKQRQQAALDDTKMREYYASLTGNNMSLGEKINPLLQSGVSPEIVGRLATSELGRQQDVETQKAKVEKLKAEADVKTKGYTSLYNTYGKSPEAMQIINDNASIGNPPEKALADIQALRTAKAGKSTTTIGGEKELLLSQAGDIKLINTMIEQGVNFGDNLVKLVGKDNARRARVVTNSGTFEKTDKGIYWYNGKEWEKLIKKGDKWIAPKWKNKEIDKGIIASLNDGYTAYQKAKIGSTGKSTDNFENRFK